MLSTLGYWLSVSFLVTPIPLVLVFFGCILFRDSYRSNLEQMGMGWREARDCAFQHPLVRWTGCKCFESDAVIALAMTTFGIQMTVYLGTGIFCLAEGLSYPSTVIRMITSVSEVVGPILGYIFIVIVSFAIIPVAGKVAAKVTFLSAKINKLGGKDD